MCDVMFQYQLRDQFRWSNEIFTIIKWLSLLHNEWMSGLRPVSRCQCKYIGSVPVTGKHQTKVVQHSCLTQSSVKTKGGGTLLRLRSHSKYQYPMWHCLQQVTVFRLIPMLECISQQTFLQQFSESSSLITQFYCQETWKTGSQSKCK